MIEKLFYITTNSFTQLRNISEDVPDSIRDKAVNKRHKDIDLLLRKSRK